MLALRIFGGIFAVFLLVQSSLRYNRRSISRLNLIISWTIGALVLILAIAPVVFNPIFDAFKDATSEVAREAGAIVVRNPIRRGGGLALRVGYEVAARLNAEIVVSIDADGQHLPEEMPVLVKPVVAGDADMVNGSRLLGD